MILIIDDFVECPHRDSSRRNPSLSFSNEVKDLDGYARSRMTSMRVNEINKDKTKIIINVSDYNKNNNLDNSKFKKHKYSIRP